MRDPFVTVEEGMIHREAMAERAGLFDERRIQVDGIERRLGLSDGGLEGAEITEAIRAPLDATIAR